MSVPDSTTIGPYTRSPIGPLDDVANLSKTVSLNIGPNAPTYKRCPEAMEVSTTSCLSGGTDSGYASQSSTPDRDNSGFAVEKIVASPRLWPRAPRKVVKLRQFDKPIPKLTRNRFEDLRELHASEINKLTKGFSRSQGTLMTLKVLGESEAEAKPWVFIQCDKTVERKIKSFFKQPSIKDDYQPFTPDSYSPYFEIYICTLPPRELFDRKDELAPPDTIIAPACIAVYGKFKYGLSAQETLCGTMVRADVVGSRTATIGGIISVVRHLHSMPQLYGLTAAHFATQVHRSYGSKEDYEEDSLELCHITDKGASMRAEPRPDIEQLPTHLSMNLSETASENDDDFSEGDCYELILDSDKDASSDVEDNFEIDNSGDFSGPDWVPIGHVSMTSHDNLGQDTNYDWALIELAPEACLPNLPPQIIALDTGTDALPSLSTSEMRGSISRYVHGLGSAVILHTASSGYRIGVLSKSWSYLILKPGTSFVRTLCLTLSNGQALKPGDSGTWAFGVHDKMVYGQVVASDIFGNVYVVPIDDILRDIRTHCSADRIDLHNPSFCEFGSNDSGYSTMLSSPSV